MNTTTRTLTLAVALTLWAGPAALADEEAPVPEDYQAPLSTVSIFTAWEAPRSTVSLFYTDPGEASSGDLEEALDVTTEDEEQVVLLSDRFLFDFDSATLRPTAEKSLDNVVALLEESDTPIEVIGHTDGLGTDAVNQPLSEDRAKAVAEYLSEHGVKDSRISVSGKGSSEPIADNTYPDGRDNPEGRQQNRRVEIRYTNG